MYPSDVRATRSSRHIQHPRAGRRRSFSVASRRLHQQERLLPRHRPRLDRFSDPTAIRPRLSNLRLTLRREAQMHLRHCLRRFSEATNLARLVLSRHATQMSATISPNSRRNTLTSHTRRSCSSTWLRSRPSPGTSTMRSSCHPRESSPSRWKSPTKTSSSLATRTTPQGWSTYGT